MSYIKHFDAPQFFTGDVCKAAGIDQTTLKNWITRDQAAILISDEHRAAYGVEGPSHERLAAGSGRSHLFTFRRVLQIALIAELVSLGVAPRRAGVLALRVTDTGEPGAIHGSSPIRINRRPGMLYAEGFTLLVASKEREFIVNAKNNQSLFSILARVEGSAVLILDVGAVYHRVITCLDLGEDWMPVEVTNND